MPVVIVVIPIAANKGGQVGQLGGNTVGGMGDPTAEVTPWVTMVPYSTPVEVVNMARTGMAP